ncbi:MAG: hypothetical protein QM516_05080 [Limnohabitans sp.]|jgi:hypothetical protein|nr:hypothetical protein [Limnohabitans sp.]
MGRREKEETPKWGKRTPPKSERAVAAAEIEAEERRKAAGLSRSAEALRTPTLRILGEKSKFLSVDLGLATGIAVFGRDGRLEAVRTRRFQSKDALRAASAAILDEVPHVHTVIVEGGGELREAWERAAVYRGIHFRAVQASAWRSMFLYERESRDGAMAKESAVKLAAQVIAWSATRGVGAAVEHDAAEAILVGLYGVVQAGWLREMPRFRR